MADWKAKEYYTVLLRGIPAAKLTGFLRGTLGLRESAVIQSHFYTEESGEFSYSDALDLAALCTEGGSGTVYTESLCFDRAYRNVLCCMNTDGEAADLEFDIEEQDFDTVRLPEMQAWLFAQLHAKTAESVSISFTLDTAPLFETGKGEQA